MSTYAQIADLMSYSKIRLNTQDDHIQDLLDSSEQDVDLMFNPSDLTDSLQGFSISGNPTGGSWSAQILWQGDTWTSLDIPWNASGLQALGCLNASTNALGQPYQGTSWERAITPAYMPDWSFGQLPTKPIVVQATAYMGNQVLPPFTVTSNLTGDDTARVNVTQFRGGGTRLDVWMLQPSQRYQLTRATCAQAEYRDQMGEDFFIKAQYTQVTGPEFTTQGQLPILGPKVMRELNGSGLVQYGTRAAVGVRGSSAYAYQRFGGTPIPDDWRAV
jgi:hypothetical protein